MRKKVPEFSLPSADDLFSSQAERDDAKREKIIDIPLDSIDSFPDHPFQVKLDDSMQLMVDSVKSVGIQTPAVVRLKDDGRYEMISGHRRKFACEMAGIMTIPCIIRELSHDEAIISMIDSNLQREVILPSEKAKSYKMRLDAMKRQVGRPIQTNYSPAGNSYTTKTSSAELSLIVGESKNQIFRYIRLTELISEILDMVDEGQLSMRSAVELSYLTHEQQQMLLDIITCEERTPTHAQATKLRRFSDDGRLTEDVILSIIQENKPNQPEHFKLPKTTIQRFFADNTSTKVIEETIIKALILWQDVNKQ